jgi:hypothetical protein
MSNLLTTPFDEVIKQEYESSRTEWDYTEPTSTEDSSKWYNVVYNPFNNSFSLKPIKNK